MRRLSCRHAPHRHDCGANAGDSWTARGSPGGDGRRRRAGGGGSDDAASASSERFEGRSDGGELASEGVGAGPGDSRIGASALGWAAGGGGESRGAMAAGAGKYSRGDASVIALCSKAVA